MLVPICFSRKCKAQNTSTLIHVSVVLARTLRAGFGCLEFFSFLFALLCCGLGKVTVNFCLSRALSWVEAKKKKLKKVSGSAVNNCDERNESDNGKSASSVELI